MSKAFIQKPAPPFSGTAVNHYGEFVDIKLSDFKGMRSAFYWKKMCFISFDFTNRIPFYSQENMWCFSFTR